MIHRYQSVFFVLSENCHRRKYGTINQRCVVIIRCTCIVFETLTAEIAVLVFSTFCTSDIIFVNNTWLHWICKGFPSVGPIRPSWNHLSNYRLISIPARLSSLVDTDYCFIAIENLKIIRERAVWCNCYVRIFYLYIYERWAPRDTSRSLYID